MTIRQFGIGIDIVGAIDDSFHRAIRQAQAETSTLAENIGRGLSDAAKKATTAFGRVSRSPLFRIGALAAGTLGAGLASATNQAVKFESTMAGVSARLTDATEAQRQQLAGLAQDLGASTDWSARQVGEGMQFLAQAGLQTNEVLAVTPGLLDLATAGTLDLGKASDIATNILSGMNLEVSETGHVVDVLAQQANSSNTSVEQIGLAMSYAAPQMAAFGVSTDTAAGALGALADAGIQGERGGTALRGVLAKLTEEATDGAVAIGGHTVAVYDSGGAARQLTDILSDLSVATAGMTDAQKQAALGNITNRETLGPLLVLLRDGAKATANYAAANRDAAGAAHAMAATLSDTTQGRLRALRSSIEAVQIAVGNVLIPVLADVAEAAANAIRPIAKWIQQHQELAAVVVKVTAVFVGGVGLLPAIAGVVAALGVLAGPAGWIGLAAGAFVSLYERVEWFRDSTNAVVGSVLKNLQRAGKWLARVPGLGFLGMAESIEAATPVVAGATSQLTDEVLWSLPQPQEIGEATSTAMAAAVVEIEATEAPVVVATKSVATQMVGALTGAASAVRSAMDPVGIAFHAAGAAADAAVAPFQFLGEGLAKVGNLLGVQVQPAAVAMKLALLSIVAVLSKALGPIGAFNAIWRLAKGTMEAIQRLLWLLGKVFVVVTNVVKGVSIAVEWSVQAWNALKNALGTAGKWVTDAARKLGLLGNQAQKTAAQMGIATSQASGFGHGLAALEKELEALSKGGKTATAATTAFSAGIAKVKNLAGIGVPALAAFGGAEGAIVATLWTVVAAQEEETLAKWASIAAKKVHAAQTWLSTTAESAFAVAVQVASGEITFAEGVTWAWTGAMGALDAALLTVKNALRGVMVTLNAMGVGEIILLVSGITLVVIELYKNVGIFRSIVDGAASAVWGFLRAIAGAGRAIVHTLVDGVKAAGHLLVKAVEAVLWPVRWLLPFSDAKTGPLADLTASGRSIPVTIAQGVAQAAPELSAAVVNMAASAIHSIAGGDAIDKFIDAGAAIPRAIAEGILATGQAVGDALKNVVHDAIAAVPLRSVRAFADRAFGSDRQRQEAKQQRGVGRAGRAIGGATEALGRRTLGQVLPGIDGGHLARWQQSAADAGARWWDGIREGMDRGAIAQRAAINAVRDEVLITGIHRTRWERVKGDTALAIREVGIRARHEWREAVRTWHHVLNTRLDVLAKEAGGWAHHVGKSIGKGLEKALPLVAATAQKIATVTKTTMAVATAAINPVGGALHAVGAVGDGIKGALRGLGGIVQSVGGAFGITSESVQGLAEHFGIGERAARMLTKGMGINTDMATGMRVAFLGIFAVIAKALGPMKALQILLGAVKSMFRLLIGTIKVLKAIGAGLARVIQMCTNAFKRIRDAAVMARTALQNFLKALAKVPGIGKLVQITTGGITKKLKQQTFATKLAAAAMRGLGTAAVIGIPLLGAFGGQLGLIIALVWSLVAGLSAEQWAQIKSTAARVANVTATVAQTAAQWLLIVPLKVATGVMTIQAAKTFYLTGLTKVWTAVTKGAAAVQAFYSKALAATTAWLKRQGILAIWNAVATKASTLATKLLIAAKIQLAGALAATTAWLQRQGVLTTWNLVVTKATTLATTVLTAAKTRLVGALAAGVIGWKALNVQQLINKVRTWLSVAATTALTVAKTHLVGAIAAAVIGWKALNVQQLIHKVRTWLSVAATTALTAVTKYAALTQLFFAHGMKVAGVWALALKAKLIGVKIATLSLQIAARATFIGWVPFLAGAAKALLVVGGALKVVMFGVIGLAKAIAATGIGAIVIGVGLLILLFVKLEKRFGLLGKLFKWFGKLGKIVAAPFIELWNWGKKVGPGLFSAIGEGIRRSVNLILTPMRWAFGLVKRLLPQSDALEGPFSQLTAAGRSIPETIGKGIRQAGPEPITEPIRQTLGPSPVSAVVQQLTAPAAAAVTTAAPPATAPAPAAGGITVGTIVINAESGDPAAIEAAVMEALAKADRQQRAQDRAALHDFASL